MADEETNLSSVEMDSEDDHAVRKSGKTEENESADSNKDPVVSDEEEEKIHSKRKKVRRPVIIDDDDDDDSNSQFGGTSSGIDDDKQTSDQNVESKNNDNDESDSDSSISNVLKSNSLKENKSKNDYENGEDSDSDIQNDLEKSQEPKLDLFNTGENDNANDGENTINKLKLNSDLFDAEDSDSENGDENTKKHTLDNGDLFDTEENNGAANSDNNSVVSSDHSDNEENIDSDKEEKTGRWTNCKGASKGAKKERPKQRAAAKRSMDEIQSIHSETQRMVREGQLKLPYHNPKPLSLLDILNKKKNSKIDTIRPTPNLIREMSKNTPTKPSKPKPSKGRVLPQLEESSDVADKVAEKANNSSLTVADKCQIDSDDELPDLQISVTPENRKQSVDKSTDDLPVDAEQSNNSDPKSKTESQEFSLDSGFASSQHNDAGLADLSEKQSQESESDSSEKPDNIDTQQKENISAVDSGAIDLNLMETDDNTKGFSQINDISFENSQKLPLSEVSLNEGYCPKLNNRWAKLSSDLPENIINLKPAIGFSSTGDDFIDLDSSDNEGAKPNPGVTNLMMKLLKHSKKPVAKSPSHAKVNIVKKEIDGENKESLQLETMVVPLTAENDSNSELQKPGAKLSFLKERLKKGMKQKRDAALKQRIESYDLENEEGFDDEEEAELTDPSDSEDEAVDENKKDEDVEENEEENPDENDEEADAGEGSESEMHLKLDGSDDEDEEITKDDEESSTSKSTNKEDGKMVLNFSNLSERIDYKPSQDDDSSDSEMPEMFTSTSKPRSSPTTPELFSDASSQIKSRQSDESSFKIPPLTFPIEESQDLYSMSLSHSDAHSESSTSVRMYMEESQSQLLDEDGFLKVRSTGKKSSNRQLKLTGLIDSTFKAPDGDDELLDLCSGNFSADSGAKSSVGLKGLMSSQKVDPMDELAGLCTGQFPSSVSSQKPSEFRSLFASTQKQDSMDEIVGLCSGKFTGTRTATSDSKDDEDNGEDDNIGDADDELDLQLPSDSDDNNDSDVEDQAQENNLDSDEEIEDVSTRKRLISDEGEEEDDDILAEEFPPSFTGFREGSKKGKMRKEFLEAEAELSGSEYGSDEDVDLDERDDVMEAEAGDADDVGSDAHLRDQVGRVHLKSVIDEDKRQLRLMQEMYLPDGDLHTDGAGRQRRFNWKHLDNDMSQDMFTDDVDGELKEDDQENDNAWRQQRFEREKFLAEQNKDVDDVQDENSQFAKLSNMILKKAIAPKDKISREATGTSIRSQRRGSFLSRNKNALAKIAEVTKPVGNPGKAAVNSRKFVFSTVSPDTKNNQQKKTLARSSSVIETSSQQPPSKKPRLEQSQSQSSIFNHL